MRRLVRVILPLVAACLVAAAVGVSIGTIRRAEAASRAEAALVHAAAASAKPGASPSASARPRPTSTAVRRPAPSATASPATGPTTSPAPASTTAAPTAPATAAAQAAFEQAAAAAMPASMGSAEVVDLTTGESVTYGDPTPVQTASIIKVGILATLELQHQAAGTSLTADEESLAEGMIEHSDNDDASALWDQIGGAEGYLAGITELGLTQTTPDPDAWGLTTTTAADQIRLLEDLLSDASPLTPASRTEILELMRNVESDQAWGATALDPGAAVKTGFLPLDADGQSDCVVNTVGIADVRGHTLLVAIVSVGWDSEWAGSSALNEIAADAAAALVG